MGSTSTARQFTRTKEPKNIFYWSNEMFGLKPVASLTHTTIWRDPNAIGDTVITSQQLYASHYFNASLGVTLLFRDDRDENGGLVLAYVNRTIGSTAGWVASSDPSLAHAPGADSPATSGTFGGDSRRNTRRRTLPACGCGATPRIVAGRSRWPWCVGNGAPGAHAKIQVRSLSGPVAQLGARMNGIHEVAGSIPAWSTTLVFEGCSGCNQLKAGAVTAVRTNSFPSNEIPSGKNSC